MDGRREVGEGERRGSKQCKKYKKIDFKNKTILTSAVYTEEHRLYGTRGSANKTLKDKNEIMIEKSKGNEKIEIR